MVYSQTSARLIASQANARTLRQELHPSTVMWLHGERQPDAMSGLRLHYVSPFRQDNSPSLDVWRDENKGEWRCGDFAEQWQGSPIDLEQRFSGEDDSDAIDRCREHYEWQLVHDIKYDVNKKSSTAKFLWKPPEHNDYVAKGWHLAMLAEKPCMPPVGFLREQFDIVIGRNETVWCPSFWDSEVVAYKRLSRKDGKKQGFMSETVRYRSLDSEIKAQDGIYPLLLTEGESDTWVAEYLFGQEYAVIGFPGASTNPEVILKGIPLQGRRVVVVFDGDEPGTNCRRTLCEWLVAKEAIVSVVPMPDGKDVAALEEPVLRELVEEWQMPFRPTLHVTALDDGYYRLTGAGQQGSMITDWLLNVERLLISDDPEVYGFEGTLLPVNKKVTLLSTQLEAGEMKKWCRVNRVSWQGNATDLEKLGALLRFQATLCPVGRMTTRVGLHNKAFVWPDQVVGLDDWHYVPPDSGFDLRDKLTLGQVLPSREQIREVMENLVVLHDEYVTVTTLAWLAVAPLRPLFDKFPILHVTGSSGSGKTSMMQTMLHAFSGSGLHYTLTSTTPYAVAMSFEAVNCVPIWFDEYRPGARSDTKMFLDQLLRDSYTGQLSSRGEMSSRGAKMRNVRTDAPVIVTGEDTFTERSHLDRSIILHLKKGGRNEKAMAFFDFISPITLSYLKFLVSNRYTEDPIITKKLSMEGGKSDKLNDRQLRNLWTIQFGHRLLNQWLSDERIDYQIPDLSWDMLIADSVRDAATNPILDLIWWAHDMHHSSAVILNDDVIYIHPMELMRLAKSPSGPPIQLPFSSGNALRLHLIDEYDALPRTVNSDVSKVPVRMYEMDVSKVEQMD